MHGVVEGYARGCAILVLRLCWCASRCAGGWRNECTSYVRGCVVAVSEDVSEDVLEGVSEVVDCTGGCTGGCLVITL